MKVRIKVVCTFLTLSKKPPPPLFQILATRLPSPPKWNATNDKNVTNKPIASSASAFFSIFRVQQYTRKTVINNNIDNQGARVPSIQFLLTNLYV